MSTVTKKALAASLKKLMNNISLEKITIKSIVEDCGVNRQTFYYHFQDIYDLLGWIYKTEAIGRISDCKTYNTWQEGFLKIFEYVKENKNFCMNTFHSMGREHLEDFLYEQVFKLIIDVVDEICVEYTISDDFKKFISDFYTYAFIGLLTSWMKNNMQENPEEIIKKLERLISGNLERALKSL